MKRSEFFDVVGYFGNHFGKFGAFGSRYPGKLYPVFVKTHEIEQFLGDQEATAGKIIPADVMTVARVATRNQHAIGRCLKRFDQEPRVDP